MTTDVPKRRWYQFNLQTFLVLITLTVSYGCFPPSSPPDVDSLDALSYSSDGKLLAAGGYKWVELWDTATGKSVGRFEEHSAEVYSVGFSPDGQYVASGGRDRSVRVWDPTTSQAIAVLKFEQSVISVIFSPDGRTLVSADLSGRVIFWDTEDWSEKWTIRRHYISSVAVSPNGKLLAFVVRHLGGRDVIELWDMEQRTMIRELNGDEHSPLRVAFSPTGGTLASIGYLDDIIVWNVTTGVKESQFQAATNSHRTMITFSPDGKLLTTGGHDGKIRLWSAESGQEMATLEGHDSGVVCLAFSPSAMVLASGDGGHHAQVFLWDVAEKKVLMHMTPLDETAAKTGIYTDSENPPGSTSQRRQTSVDAPD